MTAYKAIETKYLPATNTRGSRIKAFCEAGSVTIGYPHEYSGAECHWQAAKKLIERLNWGGKWYAGGTQKGYVFVAKHSDNCAEA